MRKKSGKLNWSIIIGLSGILVVVSRIWQDNITPYVGFMLLVAMLNLAIGIKVSDE